MGRVGYQPHLTYQSRQSACYALYLVMDHLNEISERQAGTDRPEPAPPIQSRFLFVDVAALRAKQLRRGARPRLESADAPVLHKAERLAMEEVRRGLVDYNISVPDSRLASRDGEA